MSGPAARDMLAGLSQRRQTIPTPFVHENSTSSTPESGVKHIYSYFLDLTGNGPYFANARSWSGMSLAKTLDGGLFFFEMMILQCETHSEGSFRPTAKREAAPELYKKTVELAAKGVLGLLSTQQQILFKSFIHYDAFVDMRFNYDVECATAVMRYETQKNAAKVAADEVEKKKLKLAEKKSKGKGKKKGRADEAEEGEEEEQEEEEEENVVVNVAPLKRSRTNNAAMEKALREMKEPEAPPPVLDEIAVQIVLGEVDIMLDESATCTEVMSKAVLDRLMARDTYRMGGGLDAARERLLRENAAAGGEEEMVATVDPDRPTFAPFEGAEIVPKIQFTVTPVPKAGGNVKVPTDVVGLMCLFLVRDTSINPGSFFENMLKNVKFRLDRMREPRGNQFQHREMFPNYVDYFATNHPMGNSIDMQGYLRAALQVNPKPPADAGANKTDLYMHMRITDYKHWAHLSNLMSIERAIKAMIDAGGDPGVVGTAAKWWNMQTRTVTFPRGVPTYKYHPEQVFLNGTKYLGMWEQYFPHIDMSSDFLEALLTGDSIERFLSTKEYQNAEQADRLLSRTVNDIRDMIARDWKVERATLNESKLVGYPTNNEFIHRAAEAAQIDAAIMKQFPAHASKTFDEVKAFIEKYPENWKERLKLRNPNLHKRYLEYERFCELRFKAQDACVKVFSTLWQLEGDIEQLSIPDSIKAMLRWYRNNKAEKLPHMTRHYMMWDKRLGLFGNSMLHMLKQYTCVAKILQPIVCLLAHGLFSCYHHAPQQLRFNFLLHGRFDVGKTYMAITTLVRFCIPGTVMQYVAESGAADTTRRHSYDLIIASDEVMPWKVSEAEAQKKPDLVNKAKIKMTTGQIGYRVFVFRKDPVTGESYRDVETITTDHHVTLVEVTNNMVEATGALSSRYFRQTVAPPKVPVREYEGMMNASLKADTVTFLHINQFLSACTYKAVMCGAMIDVNMQLFSDISSRVVNYLLEKKAVTQDVGQRGLEIMLPYARQLVIQMAIHCAFDMPGVAVNYKKEFTPAMIQAMQPFLYCTTEIVWWCWTAMSPAWIDENNSKVIRACVAQVCCDFEWDENDTNYGMYEKDISEKIPWRIIKTPNFTGDKKLGNHETIDINYITLEGTFEQICRAIARQSGLDWTDVMGIFNVLATKNVSLPGGGYVPQLRGQFREWHKYKELPVDAVANVDGTIRVPAKPGKKQTAANVPYEYRGPEGDNWKKMRTEEHVPKYGDGKAIPIVDMSDLKRFKKLYVMPQIAAVFCNDKIIEALMYATLTTSTRQGKFLLGMPMMDDPMNLTVFDLGRGNLDKFITMFDEQDGWGPIDPITRKPTWLGDPEIPKDERPVSRREGISFNRRGGISDVDSIFFTSGPAAPKKDYVEDNDDDDDDDDDAGGNSNPDKVNVRDVCANLDAEAAKQHHIKCGLPVTMTVWTPAKIKEAYKKGCKDKGRKWTEELDYPHDVESEVNARQAVWATANQSAKNTSAIMSKAMAMAISKPVNQKTIARNDERRKIEEVKKRAALSSSRNGSGGGHGSSSSAAASPRPDMMDEETRPPGWEEPVNPKAPPPPPQKKQRVQPKKTGAAQKKVRNN